MHQQPIEPKPEPPSGFQVSKDGQGQIHVPYQRRNARMYLALGSLAAGVLICVVVLTAIAKVENEIGIPGFWIKVAAILNISVFTS